MIGCANEFSLFFALPYNHIYTNLYTNRFLGGAQHTLVVSEGKLYAFGSSADGKLGISSSTLSSLSSRSGLPLLPYASLSIHVSGWLRLSPIDPTLSLHRVLFMLLPSIFSLPIFIFFSTPVLQFQWVVTVPSIWTPNSKRIMTQAAQQAGLCTEQQQDRLRLALEPEVAAICCLDEMKKADRELPPNTTYMVVDCGGGTVDIAREPFMSCLTVINELGTILLLETLVRTS